MPKLTDRLGFHYFPDTTHYREQDLNTWLPELEHLGANWLTLLAPVERAIPEFFIRGIISAGIRPVLHFPISLNLAEERREIQPLCSTYARWGVQYIALFDRPNCRAAWGAGPWAQVELVERFLDLYLPLAEMALGEGLVPVFPPLQPGGDYWDLAFLQNALRGMVRRNKARLVEKMVLGVYAWVNSRPLDWGVGGRDRWPGAKPYSSAPGVQDHMGFRIFDWYEDVCQDELGYALPMILLRAGALPNEIGKVTSNGGLQHAQINLAIAKSLSGEEDKIKPIQENVLACNFWLLAAEGDSKYQTQAWFQSENTRLPVVDVFRQWIGVQPPEMGTWQGQVDDLEASKSELEEEANQVDEPVSEGKSAAPAQNKYAEKQPVGEEFHPIAHYVLLPLYAWGAGEWDLELIQPWINETHPTVGFSLAEARLARRVSVVGGPGAISDEVLRMLRLAGCQVERVLADGTVIAT